MGGMMLFDIVLNLARPWPLKLLIDNVIGHHRIPHWVATIPVQERSRGC